jgi:glycosyltransferase involved in cell wall biosynthesis
MTYRELLNWPDHPLDESKGACASRLPAGFAWTAKRRVCIVTTEFHGLFKNGGIGTANTGLALVLAEAGCSVTVLFANLPVLPDPELRRLQERYRAIGIQLEILLETSVIRKPFTDHRSASYAVYLYLREREFDVVYFHDNCARGFYSLAAKHTGCFHAAPLMLVVAHGPSEWVYELNSMRYYDKRPIIGAYLERRSVELADALISPSQYLVDWMVARGWKLPAHVFVEQNIVRVTTPPSRCEKNLPQAVKEVVFFGRNEVRKGLVLFCDAIDLLKELVDLGGLQITFLGKFSEIHGMHSGMYVVERSTRWKTPVRVLAKFDQVEALRYLSRFGTLAVIPSLAENSPCVIIECLQLGIPFIATNRGGTAELIDPADVEHCLVSPDPKALAERLANAVESGHGCASLAISQVETEKRWRLFHGIGDETTEAISASNWRATPGWSSRQDVAPLASICLTISNELTGLEHILGAILEQSYKNYEVIIVGSNGIDSHAMDVLRDTIEQSAGRALVRLISHGHLEAAEARNLAAAQARGQFLLFLDETNVILTETCLDVLVTAAIRTDADLITGFALKLEQSFKPQEGKDGELYNFPIGACAEIGIVENCFGDGLALVRKQAFKQMAGFSGRIANQASYWHLFVTAVMSDLSLEVVPQPVFWHREGNSGDLGNSNLLDSHRVIVDIYGQKQLRTVRYLFETFIDVRAENKRKLDRFDITPAQRDLVLRVSGLAPNGQEAIEGFLQYSLERGRVQDALEFAMYNDSAGGPAVRWTRKETAIEFEWPFPTRWEFLTVRQLPSN